MLPDPVDRGTVKGWEVPVRENSDDENIPSKPTIRQKSNDVPVRVFSPSRHRPVSGKA
jgi:hypothetical protein